MKVASLIAAATLFGASAAALANPASLTTTLIAPPELQLEEPDLYRVKVQNPSLYPANNVVLRVSIPPGMLLFQPTPPYCTLLLNAPMQTGGPITRHVRCLLTSIPAQTTWVWDLLLRAPSVASGPVVFGHQAIVTSSNVTAPVSLSPVVTTNYQNFTLPIVPGSHWEGESCTLGTGSLASEGTVPVPYGICTKPASQNLPGSFRLLANGVVDATESPHLGLGMTAQWLQPTSPSKLLRYVEPGGPAFGYSQAAAMLRLVNSRCFRGQSQTTPYPGNPTYHGGLRLCLIP